MKKLLLLIIIITTFSNVIYASFPVIEVSTIYSDTIPDTNKVVNKETTEEYHIRIQKQGFDIKNCMCEDCRKFKGSDIKHRQDRYSNSRKFFGTLGSGILITSFILGFLLLIMFYNAIRSWVDNGYQLYHQ